MYAMTEPKHQPDTPAAKRIWLLAMALLLLGCALYLPKLGASALWDPWEPKYAQSARELVAEKSWLIPQYRSDERLNKPPMTYWLIALSHAAGGVSETTSRLPSALLAILGALALGLALAARGRPLEGFMAGAALLTGPQWLLLGRFATPDIPLAAFLGVALALVLYLPAARTERSRRLALVGIALCIAAAGMTDWPRGLLLPAWAVLAWAALRWNWKGPLALAVVAGLYVAGQFQYNVPLNIAAAVAAVVLAAVVLRHYAGVSWTVIVVGILLITLLVAPWFFVVNEKAPDEMSILKKYKHTFNLGESKKVHRNKWTFVTRTVAVGALPWAAVALLGLGAAVRPRGDDDAAVLAGALIGGTLFFTLSEAKMGHFYAVIQPAVAGLAGLGGVAVARRFRWSSLAAVAALLVVWNIAWRTPTRLMETATVKTNLFGTDLSMLIAGVVLAWFLVFVAAVIARRPAWVTVSVLPAALLAGTLGMHVVPKLEKYKSLGPLWDVYLAERSEGEPIGFLAPTKETIFYYSNIAVHRFGEKQEADEFLSSGRGVKFMVMNTPTIEPVIRDHPGQWRELYKEHPTHRLFRYEPDG